MSKEINQPKKNLPIYGVKSINVQIEDIDEGSRKVVGYLSAFNIIDSDFDIIRQGAYKKSITERGPNSPGNRKIAHLRQHDWNRQIGKFIELYEDSYGLKFVSELGRSDEGNNAFLDYQDGILREHSIGFNYIPDKLKFIEDDSDFGGYWDIAEVILWEGSGVTFGASEFTHVVDVTKGESVETEIQKINAQMNGLLKGLKNPNRTDESLYNIEMALKVIQQKYNSLLNYEPNPIKDHSKVKAESVKSFYQNLITK
jgi:hypothetical protein